MTKPELCREWNSDRAEGSTKYSAETYDPSDVSGLNSEDSR